MLASVKKYAIVTDESHPFWGATVELIDFRNGVAIAQGYGNRFAQKIALPFGAYEIITQTVESFWLKVGDRVAMRDLTGVVKYIDFHEPSNGVIICQILWDSGEVSQVATKQLTKI